VSVKRGNRFIYDFSLTRTRNVLYVSSTTIAGSDKLIKIRYEIQITGFRSKTC